MEDETILVFPETMVGQANLPAPRWNQNWAHAMSDPDRGFRRLENGFCKSHSCPIGASPVMKTGRLPPPLTDPQAAGNIAALLTFSGLLVIGQIGVLFL
jgi:hypothetical protein